MIYMYKNLSSHDHHPAQQLNLLFRVLQMFLHYLSIYIDPQSWNNAHGGQESHPHSSCDEFKQLYTFWASSAVLGRGINTHTPHNPIATQVDSFHSPQPNNNPITIRVDSFHFISSASTDFHICDKRVISYLFGLVVVIFFFSNIELCKKFRSYVVEPLNYNYNYQ
jgi:hypothetical protein